MMKIKDHASSYDELYVDDPHAIKKTKFVCSKCHKSMEQFFVAGIGKYRFCDKCHQNFWEFIAGLWVGDKT